MNKYFFHKGEKITIKHSNYNKFINFRGEFIYKDGLLRIEPNEELVFIILGFPSELELEVSVEKSKTISIGIIYRNDLIDLMENMHMFDIFKTRT